MTSDLISSMLSQNDSSLLNSTNATEPEELNPLKLYETYLKFIPAVIVWADCFALTMSSCATTFVALILNSVHLMKGLIALCRRRQKKKTQLLSVCRSAGHIVEFFVISIGGLVSAEDNIKGLIAIYHGETAERSFAAVVATGLMAAVAIFLAAVNLLSARLFSLALTHPLAYADMSFRRSAKLVLGAIVLALCLSGSFVASTLLIPIQVWVSRVSFGLIFVTFVLFFGGSVFHLVKTRRFMKSKNNGSSALKRLDAKKYRFVMIEQIVGAVGGATSLGLLLTVCGLAPWLPLLLTKTLSATLSFTLLVNVAVASYFVVLYRGVIDPICDLAAEGGRRTK